MADEPHLDDTITLRREAVKLLVIALGDLKEDDGQNPTASQVRLRMSELSYGGFSLGRIGLKRFRDLVDQAESEGLIKVDLHSAGDIRLSLPGDSGVSTAVEAAFHPAVWRGMVDWRPDMLRLWDCQRSRAYFFPRSSVPLEPERLAALREEVRTNASNFLELPHLSVEDQVDLLRRFAEPKLVGHDDQAQLFAAALGSRRPTQRGLQVLRDMDDAVTTEWSQLLRRTVRDRLEQWIASTSGAPTMEALVEPRTSEPTLPIDEARRKPREEVPSAATLRSAVHRAIDSLSPEELRALLLPAGVLFR